MEGLDDELRMIWCGLDVVIEKRVTLQMHGVKTVAVYSYSQAAMHGVVHLEACPGL
jgi:hypothetical protein